MYALGGFCRAEAGGQQSLSENSLGGGPVVPCYYATPLHCITLQLHYKSFGQLRHYMYIIIQSKKARTVIFLSYYESQLLIHYNVQFIFGELLILRAMLAIHSKKQLDSTRPLQLLIFWAVTYM